MEKTNNVVAVTHPSKLRAFLDSFKANMKSFRKFLFNKENREILGRDGLSWSKILFFYFVFYSVLSSFFVGYYVCYLTTIPRNKPKYVSESSLMASTMKLNPGLGFRPQIDTEDNLIFYGKNSDDQDKLTRNLRIFLNKYYDEKFEIGTSIENCQNENLDKLREEFKTKAAYCQFDYKDVLDKTTCDPISEFGYSNGPCVLIKLNKIFEWLPKPYESIEFFPLNSSIINNSSEILKNNILVSCTGEYGSDNDALKQANIRYYSANSKFLGINNIGLVPFYFYPFLNQDGYKSPLVFVHFQNIPQYQLINIVCRAYSKNIDSDDKLNLRGMVKFQLYFDK